MYTIELNHTYFVIACDNCLNSNAYLSTFALYSCQVFSNNGHNVFHDKDQDRAAQLIADWILSHCGQ